jgi:hypothetical protein
MEWKNSDMLNLNDMKAEIYEENGEKVDEIKLVFYLEPFFQEHVGPNFHQFRVNPAYLFHHFPSNNYLKLKQQSIFPFVFRLLIVAENG